MITEIIIVIAVVLSLLLCWHIYKHHVRDVGKV